MMKKRHDTNIPIDLLHKTFKLVYNDDGHPIIYWRVNRPDQHPIWYSKCIRNDEDTPVNINTNKCGYLYFCCTIDGVKYVLLVHRIVYMLHHNRHIVDEIHHINNIKTDNRPCNLMDVDRLFNVAQKDLKSEYTPYINIIKRLGKSGQIYYYYLAQKMPSRNNNFKWCRGFMFDKLDDAIDYTICKIIQNKMKLPSVYHDRAKELGDKVWIDYKDDNGRQSYMGENNPDYIRLENHKDDIIDLHVNKNKTAFYISKLYNVHRSIIVRRLKNWNIDMRVLNQSLGDHKDDIIDLYVNQNKSLEDIAELYKVASLTIRSRLIKWGVKIKDGRIYGDVYRYKDDVKVASNVYIRDWAKNNGINPDHLLNASSKHAGGYYIKRIP